ncbi:hypothetical protein GWI33_021029 [Rhynchophorus ferrugineus]|uniref:Uncharacterized protein n=1 Tax=Rhynchophorus ferrugineus TaxID=354439 RepID=A0A834M3N1_RHYFE|nr:hypothetical protein GWI33_021029 [Rhynchophorus ferrugineus]
MPELRIIPLCPLATAAPIPKVLIEPDDVEMGKSIQRMYRDRFPDLRNIKERLGVVEVTTRTGDEQGATKQKVSKITTGKTSREVWDSRILLSRKTETHNKIAIHQLRGMEMVTVRKIIESVSSRENTKVTIHVLKDQNIKPPSREREGKR